VSAAPSSATDPSTAPPATSTAPPEDPSGEDLELAETANATGEQHDDDDDDDDDDDAELDTDFPSPPPPGCLDPNNLPIELLAETFVIQRRTLMPFLVRALAVNTTGFPIISS
jgi:arginine-tRNA-protein transferase